MTQIFLGHFFDQLFFDRFFDQFFGHLLTFSLLDNIFGAPVTNGINGTSPHGQSSSPLILDHMNKFFLKNSGVVFESEQVQIGIKMEFRERLGRIQVFYGNKSSANDITNFNVDVARNGFSTFFF